jgi:predicted secreted protein
MFDPNRKPHRLESTPHAPSHGSRSSWTTRGVAIVVVLLSAIIFLSLAVAITGTLALSSRQSTTSQRLTLEAQYAAESGLSRVLADARVTDVSHWSRLVQKMQTPTSLTDAEVRVLAHQFCNGTGTAPIPPLADATYCVSSEGSNVLGRFEVFTNFISNGTTDEDGRSANDYQSVLGLPLTTSEEAYWQKVFASEQFYTGELENNVGFEVSFGLKAVRVEYKAGGVYRFVFKPRDSVSKGVVRNGNGANATVLARREMTRAYQHEYFVDIAPPSYAYYLLMTNRQSVIDKALDASGMPYDKQINVFLNGTALSNGPVHTNAQFYFTGSPWFSDTVTSSGCSSGQITTTDPPTCLGVTANTAFENNTPLDPNASTEVSNGQFSGYARDAKAGLTAPQFVKDNAIANEPPQPWNYTGEYNVPPQRLPTSSQDQRSAASTGGILIQTGADPAVSNGRDPFQNVYYDGTANLGSQLSGGPRVSLLATDTTEAEQGVHNFSTVTTSGSKAKRQLIRIQAVKKISNCHAAPTAINLADVQICANNSVTKTIGVSFQPVDDTYEAAEADPNPTPGVTWKLESSGGPSIETNTNIANKIGLRSTTPDTGTAKLTAQMPGVPDKTVNINVIAPNTIANHPSVAGIQYENGQNPVQTLDRRSYQHSTSGLVNISGLWKLKPVFQGAGDCKAFQNQNSVTQYQWSITPNNPSVLALQSPTTTNGENGIIIGNLASSTPKTFSIYVTLTDQYGAQRPPTKISEVTITPTPPSGQVNPGRPRARLTAENTCTKTKSYPWPMFIDLLIDESGNTWYREFPSSSRTSWIVDPSAKYAYTSLPRKLTAPVLYVDGGMSVSTLGGRGELSDPASSAPRSIASFFKMTIASHGDISVGNDIQYEQPACESAPERVDERSVKLAVCSSQSEWKPNALGIFTSGGNIVLDYGGLPNPQLHAVLMASGGDKQIEVKGMRITDPTQTDCPPGANGNLGGVTVQGGLIQDRYGKFGRLSDDGKSVNCGYERNMTYDPRMRDSRYAPPGFPRATNQSWQIKLYSSSNPTSAVVGTGLLPLEPGYSRNK